MKIDLNFEIKGLNGNDLGNAGKLIANALFMGQSKILTASKSYEISLKLNSEGVVDLNKDEATNLKSFVSKEAALVDGAKAQIENAILDALNKKDEENDKK